MKKLLRSTFITLLTSVLLLNFPLISLNAMDDTRQNVGRTVPYEKVSREQMEYELGASSPFKGQPISYGKDKNGDIIRISVLDYNNNTVITYSDRIATLTIAVFVGGTLVGYLSSTVIDGIVVSVTGQTGAFVDNFFGRRLI